MQTFGVMFHHSVAPTVGRLAAAVRPTTITVTTERQEKKSVVKVHVVHFYHHFVSRPSQGKTV